MVTKQKLVNVEHYLVSSDPSRALSEGFSLTMLLYSYTSHIINIIKLIGRYNSG